MIEGDWIYDIEVYPNCFTFCTVYANGQGIRVFEVSDRKNQIDDVLDFLRKVKQHNHRMVGFNNLGFDYQVLHYILEKSNTALTYDMPFSITAGEIYKIASELIKAQHDEKFGKMVWEKDVIIPQVDLYKIHHFDNKAKATSLKMLEFNMRSDNIEDLPFEVGTTLTDEEIDVLIDYNKHDVLQTLQFYYKSLDAIRFRAELTEKYGFDCTNYNDTKIGKEYFINRLEKELPGSCYKQVGRRRVLNQTIRDKIDIKDVIFPYVKFERKEFNALLEWFNKQTITETKGVFTNLMEHSLGDLARYADLTTKRKKLIGPAEAIPGSWIEEIELKSKKGAISRWQNWRVAETLNVVVDGFRLDFGVGGLHMSVENQAVYSGSGFSIIDLDVSSYYPNLAIANRVYPEHLSDKFCDIYKDVYEERKKYKKGTPENAVMKLALNGTYGDSNNQYSPFYDPQYTMSITINGQLTLCMLIEKLLLIGCELIQCNTDGMTMKVPVDKINDYYVTCKAWEKLTGLTLEFAEYEKMFIRDVNNYIAVYKED